MEFTCRSYGPGSLTFGRFYKRVGPDGPLMRLPPAGWWSGSRTTKSQGARDYTASESLCQESLSPPRS